MENQIKKLHVAILPSPFMGHLIPQFQFAKHLAILHNFQVTFFLLSTDSSSAQSQFLLHSQTLPDGLHFHHLPPLDISPFVSDSTEIQSRASIIIRESTPHIKSAIADIIPPNIFVFDFLATDAFEIADELGIPKYIFFTSPATVLPFMMYLPTLDRQIPGEFIDLKEPVRVPGCKPIPIDDLIDPVRNRKTGSYKWFLYHASRFPLVNGIFVNTCQDLEPTVLRSLREDPILRQIATPRVYPVGPLIKLDKPSSSSENLKMEYLTWLDMQPCDSVLFISFGSGGTLSAEQMTELAWGLELSQQRFIWVARKPFEVDMAAARTFFSVGAEHNNFAAYLPDGFLSRIKGLGLVIQSWAPQAEILSHSSIGGFLTHCGWNSMLESIYNGVPMIAWPLFAEQWGNATMLTEELRVAVKAGVKREKGSVVRREEIERVVRLVMAEGEEMKILRNRVKELQQNVIKSVDEDGSSYNELSEVAKEWKSNISGSDFSMNSEEIKGINEA
ncbi:UDP-glucuronosyl/UDP-glucosyltransferase [Macleaya cordata]|uniref:Glycosyltransferase n=1 Tax=Macleaya cordata TaxID=56857 RepID=A0A200QKE1_MACCD|nr:UDP-glucuronosyl/UDP-glucosyltransferase [Macleaya cordata]